MEIINNIKIIGIVGLKLSNLNLLLEQILVTYVKIIINPLTITKNIVNGIQDDVVKKRVIIQVRIVWIKSRHPIDKGVCNLDIITEIVIIIIKDIFNISADNLS